MPFQREYPSDVEFVTRRELYLTIQPLIDKQQELTDVMIGIGKDVKLMLESSARTEGAAEAHQKITDTRRFWYTIYASLFSGCIVVVVAAAIHSFV